jgi:hypothetical protein
LAHSAPADDAKPDDAKPDEPVRDRRSGAARDDRHDRHKLASTRVDPMAMAPDYDQCRRPATPVGCTIDPFNHGRRAPGTTSSRRGTSRV